MYEPLRLSAADMNESSIILGFSADCCAASASRLNSLGFTEGETVTPVLISPLGDPSAYLLGSGMQIALRRDEANHILIKRLKRSQSV